MITMASLCGWPVAVSNPLSTVQPIPGCSAVQDGVHVHDLHATILHLMVRHEKLTYRYSGRDYRLTKYGRILHDIIA